MRINIYLSGERDRRELLDRLAAAVGATSISDWLNRHLDAAEFDFDQVVALERDVLNIAAQGYISAAEEAAQQAAEVGDNQPTKLGKYAAEREAKLASDRATSPFVVRFADGSYEWYTHSGHVGYTTEDGRSTPYDRATYQVVARYVVGRGWKSTNR